MGIDKARHFEAEPYEIEVPPPESADPGSVGFLLSTLWNQSGVISIGDNRTITYNEYTPLDPASSKHSVTGCTNTAAGQIIYYFIEHGLLDLSLSLTADDAYTSVRGDTSITIKADGSTPGTISFSAVNGYIGNYDLDSAECAAALLYACGVVQQAKYSSSATSTAWSTELFYRAGLRSANHYYLATPSTVYYWGTTDAYGAATISDAGFEVIIENLLAGRPVGTSYPGHAVVIDGYDAENDRFHINFGWGNSSTTRWYSRQEMQEQGYHEFVYDLFTDRIETFTVTDDRVYGTGTLVRAFEQARTMTGANTVLFADAVAGKAVELTENIKLADAVTVRDFNMLVTVTNARNISWGMGFYGESGSVADFENFGGALIVDTPMDTNVAMYCSNGDALAFSGNGALLYAGKYPVGGNYSSGANAILAAMRSARDDATELADFVTDSADYSFYGSNNDDFIALAERSLVVGDMALWSGDDTISVTGGSRLYGDISGNGGRTITVSGGSGLYGDIYGNGEKTVTVTDGSYLYGDLSGNCAITVDSTSGVTGLIYAASTIGFVLDSAAEDHALYTIGSNVYNIFANATAITVDIARAKVGTYVLFAAADGASYADWLNRMTLTVTGSGQGDYTLCGTGTSTSEFADLVYEDRMLKLKVKQAPPAPAVTPGDLNGDGRADIVMTIADPDHPADGSTGAWLIRSDQTAVWGDLSQRNAGWEIFGTGITSAGKETNDVYVKSSGNVIGAWVTDETGKVTGWETVGEFDASTNVLGLGDFNGDGQTDLLLRNDNGAVGCFFTSGDKTGWNYFQSLGDEWTVSAVGDLNGDGRDDVVLKHDAGFAGSWLTQDDYTMAWANLDTLAEGFAIVGCGDFDGDGTSDVLLRNGGYYGAWIVENGSVSSWMGLGDLGDVAVEQIADFDADGIDDLRIRTAAGDLGAQLVKGADTLDWKYYGSVGQEWSTRIAAI